MDFLRRFLFSRVQKCCTTGKTTVNTRIILFTFTPIHNIRTSSDNVPPRAPGAESRCRLFLWRAALRVMPWQQPEVKVNSEFTSLPSPVWKSTRGEHKQLTRVAVCQALMLQVHTINQRVSRLRYKARKGRKVTRETRTA